MHSKRESLANWPSGDDRCRNGVRREKRRNLGAPEVLQVNSSNKEGDSVNRTQRE